MVRAGLDRHALVLVEPRAFGAYAAALDVGPSRDRDPLADDWAAAGRPLIVRRSGPGDSSACVPLGLPLPRAAHGRRRIALELPPDGLVPHSSPTLDEARGFAPDAWVATIDALVALGTRLGVVPRPFGSLLWQALTGLGYLAPGSDLDVLWPLADGCGPGGLGALLAGIAAAAERAPMRVDGEIVFPDGGAVQWRELYEAPEDGCVLVKDRDRIAMRPVSAFRREPDLAMDAGGAP